MRRISRKLLTFCAVAMLVSMVSSCEKLSQDISEVTIKIPMERMVFSPKEQKEGSIINQEGWYQKQVSYDVDSLLEANGSSFLEEARVINLNLGILQPSNQRLSFLRSAKVSVALHEDFADEIVVAEAEKIIAADNEISFQINAVDWRRYLRSDNFFIRVYFDIHQYSELHEATTIYVDGILKVRME